jgi:hypothetical protein
MTDEVLQYINPDLAQDGPSGWLVIVERPFTPGKVQVELWFAGISDHETAIEAVRERVSDAVSIRAPQEVSLSLKETLNLQPGEVRRL